MDTHKKMDVIFWCGCVSLPLIMIFVAFVLLIRGIEKQEKETHTPWGYVRSNEKSFKEDSK